jgi:hypothetical protein
MSEERNGLKVGDQVSLVPNGPQDGCIKDKQVGKIAEISFDEVRPQSPTHGRAMRMPTPCTAPGMTYRNVRQGDDEPFNVVASDGKAWWYEEGTLVKVKGALKQQSRNTKTKKKTREVEEEGDESGEEGRAQTEPATKKAKSAIAPDKDSDDSAGEEEEEEEPEEEEDGADSDFSEVCG